MVGDDAPVLQREHIQRSLELVARQNEWNGELRLLPSRDERHQAREIVERDALDQAERAYVAVRSVGGERVQPVGHERLQPRAEDGAEIGNERIERCALTIRQPCR